MNFINLISKPYFQRKSHFTRYKTRLIYTLYGFLLVVLIFMLPFSSKTQESAPELALPQIIDGKWMIRFNHPDNQDIFEVSTKADGFEAVAGDMPADNEPGYVYFHLKLDAPISGLNFNLEINGESGRTPVMLFNGAAKKLWQFEGQNSISQEINLDDIKATGQLIFRIKRKSFTSEERTLYKISEIELHEDPDKPEIAEDGFIEIDSFEELRGYANQDDVKVRLRPGVYRLEKALYHHFIEFTGNGSHFDLTGVRIQVNTSLFRQFGSIPGEGGFYSAIDISGKRTTLEGAYIETYGDQPGIQSRNKIFNLTGNNVALRNVTVRTAGSVPWGYGSLFGIGGGIVRKMNGIRIGAPASGVQLIGCKVHMRAMGHAIFVQGASNTLIRDCQVDGLLRPTNDILKETSGIAFERDFKIRGSGEGVKPDAQGRIPPDEMVSLSEDGIRLYPSGGDGSPTGRTTIINCTVKRMRRGICTAFGKEPNRVIGSEAIDCIAAGFNVGSNDEVVGCRANARYAEALSLPFNQAEGANIDLEILDSRDGMANDLLVKINGKNHQVVLQTPREKFIPGKMSIELGSNNGYLGKNAGYGTDRADGTASNVELINYTKSKVLITDRVSESHIISKGQVEHPAGSSNQVKKP